MAYSISLTPDEIVELKRLRRLEKEGKILRRYQCIWMAHEDFPKKEIASTLGVNIDTVTDWIKLFNKGRLEGLACLKYDGRRPSGLDAVKDLLIAYIKRESVSKLSELQDYLLTNHSLAVEHSWLSRYCKKNSIALIKRQG
jgi:transposase